jgi:hypothetical protein
VIYGAAGRTYAVVDTLPSDAREPFTIFVVEPA